VRPVVVVVVKELPQQTPKMLLVQHDNVVKQLTPPGSDAALHDTVLPGAPKTGPHRSNLHVPENSTDLGREDRVPIHQEIPRRYLERERLAKLLNDPLRRWVRRHVLGAAAGDVRGELGQRAAAALPEAAHAVTAGSAAVPRGSERI